MGILIGRLCLQFEVAYSKFMKLQLGVASCAVPLLKCVFAQCQPEESIASRKPDKIFVDFKFEIQESSELVTNCQFLKSK
jgi:hypothetical protein